MDRFWNKVKIPTDPSYCWIWTAGKDKAGYGKFHFEGETNRAHRISWILVNGEIERSLCVCHKCDNRICVNPEHLFLGTISDNNFDMCSKGRDRHPRWGEHWKSKITIDQAREIKLRRNLGESCTSLASEFGLSINSISWIGLGKQWKGI